MPKILVLHGPNLNLLGQRETQHHGSDTRSPSTSAWCFTHTSVALRDALAAAAIPFIEVHLSNVHAREPFRQHSYFSDLARGVICGLGPQGYELALGAAMRAVRA